MGRTLTNDFSWSVTRDAAFRKCPRAYYYSYYGSWYGWDRNAPETAQRLYRLKQIKSLAMWAGTVVHDTIRLALTAFARSEQPFPTTDSLQNAALLRMRTDWRDAIQQVYLQKPKAANLFELYYGNGKTLPKETTDAIKALIFDCLDNFTASRAVRDIRNAPPSQWRAIDSLDSFDLDGLKVWGAPDFAFVDQNGLFHIIDWKTGTEDREALNLQLACYALYALDKWKLESVERLQLCGVFLRDGGRVSRYPIKPENLISARDVILTSAKAMKAKLTDPDANTADEKDFPCTPSPYLCAQCPFREACPAVNGQDSN